MSSIDQRPALNLVTVHGLSTVSCEPLAQGCGQTVVSQPASHRDSRCFYVQSNLRTKHDCNSHYANNQE